MVEVHLKKRAELQFQLHIEGTEVPPTSKLRIPLKEGELVFPGVVSGDVVTIQIPSLAPYKEQLGGTSIQATLQVVLEENYFEPWQDTISIINPISVQAEAVQSHKPQITQKPSAPRPSVTVTSRILEDSTEPSPNVQEFFKALSKK